MKPKTYDHRHPLLVNKDGDPARGEWVTKKMSNRKEKRK